MSQRNLIPSHEYDLKEISYGFRLGEGQAGCLKVMGMIFMTPGIFMLLALFQLISVKTPPPQSVEWLGLLGLALAFLCFGLFMGFYRSYTDIDLRRREVRAMSGLFSMQQKDRYALDDVKELGISRMVVPDSDGPDDVVFPVNMLSDKGHNFVLGYYRDMADAMRVAVTIAGRLGVKVYDTTVAARPEITAADILRQAAKTWGDAVPAAYSTQGLPFVWDGNNNSLSQLLTAAANGVNFYRVEYPKYLLPRFFVVVFAWGFYINFFGWRIDQSIVEIFSGYFDHLFFSSVEIFFTTIIGSAFALFLIVAPLLSFIYLALRPARYIFIGVGGNGLYLHDPTPLRLKRRNFRTEANNLLIRYADIKGLDIKIKKARKDGKQWKIEKVDNFIALRVGTDFYEIACGLEREQLEIIARDIRNHMM